MNNATPHRGALLLVLAAVAATAPAVTGAQERPADAASRVAARLAPTAHPALPGQPSDYWLVPDASARAGGNRVSDAEAKFVRAVRLLDDRQLEAAQALIDPNALTSTPLRDYALYYKAVALMGLNRYSDAEMWLMTLQASRPQGYVREALALRLAELAMARGDAKRAVDNLDHLTGEKLSAPEEVWLQLGRAAERAGDRDKALKAYRRVYYDFALSTQAADAQAGIERLQTADLIPSDRFKQELGRAEKLFDARRWAQARAAFESLSRVADNEDGERVALRMAECDYYLDRFRIARDELRPYLKGTSREAEARFFYLTATRALGDQSTYLELARALVADFPNSSWSEEVLNNLASHYIIEDDDAAADATFRDLYERFPQSRYAERAAWKIGWRAYRSGDYAEAARIFDEAAAAYPRADYRPSWLYWSGRSRDKMNDPVQAAARYRIAIADYENSYYGRLAAKLLAGRSEPATLPTVALASISTSTPQPIPTDAAVRELVGLELYDLALRELQYAQRVWGDTPQIQATVAFIRHNQAVQLRGIDRFNALRGAITQMRRAYPQFMAAGGEDLPPDVLRIIFPLDYWPLIKKYSELNDLDPYIMAALMAQESTFTPEIRSPANAFGLLQLIPSTAKGEARHVGLRYSTRLLTDPEANIRMGMHYFGDLVRQFGGVYFALASYNGGKVERWRVEKPNLPQDEFIDDIPFPETQNYVKRILGTAEDYRRLYGGGLLDPNESLHVSGAAMTPVRAARSIRTASSGRSAKATTRTKASAKATTRTKAVQKAKSPGRRPAAKSPSRRPRRG